MALLFNQIQDGIVVTVQKSVYRQSPLYHRGDQLYVKHGSGFVKLYKGGLTGVAGLSWIDIEPGDGVVKADKFDMKLVSIKTPTPIRAAE